MTLKYTKSKRVWTMGVAMRLQEEEDGCWGEAKVPCDKRGERELLRYGRRGDAGRVWKKWGKKQ